MGESGGKGAEWQFWTLKKSLGNFQPPLAGGRSTGVENKQFVSSKNVALLSSASSIWYLQLGTFCLLKEQFSLRKLWHISVMWRIANGYELGMTNLKVWAVALPCNQWSRYLNTAAKMRVKKSEDSFFLEVGKVLLKAVFVFSGD